VGANSKVRIEAVKKTKNDASKGKATGTNDASKVQIVPTKAPGSTRRLAASDAMFGAQSQSPAINFV
jgi:hypothetical protein